MPRRWPAFSAIIPIPSVARVWIAAGHTDMRRGVKGLSLYAKRLERGRFVCLVTAGESVSIAPGQLGYLLEGTNWHHPQQTWQDEPWTVFNTIDVRHSGVI